MLEPSWMKYKINDGRVANVYGHGYLMRLESKRTWTLISKKNWLLECTREINIGMKFL